MRESEAKTMIVAMQDHATEENIQLVIERMVELGFNVHRTTGAVQTILAGVGTPEHFDVAIRVQDMNFGVSPGDGFIEEPYAYVGIASPPAGDMFWNAPFGAAVPLRELPDARAATRFFSEGRDRAR